MIYIETKSTDAAYHFSVEEYLVRNFESDETLLMLWQADKCAMLGSFQIAAAEINMSCASKSKVQIVRRSSGGGTIFTDMGTLLYTMILPYSEDRDIEQLVKKSVAGPMVSALNKIGIPAKMEGRNDILVGSKKISGLAQYIRGSRICVHGSLLYDTDLDLLANVLNVDEGKISSKAISSVRSRVTNVKEHMPKKLSTDEFISMLKKSFFECYDIRNYELSGAELSEIDTIFKNKYAHTSWNFGNAPKFSLRTAKRFPAGKVEIYMDTEKNIVTSCAIYGDFLGTVPISGLEEQMINIPLEYTAMSNALEKISLRPYLGGITKEQFLSCMFE